MRTEAGVQEFSYFSVKQYWSQFSPPLLVSFINIMSRFSKRLKKPTENTTNKAGGKAFTYQEAKEELFASVCTSLLKDECYESGSERIERIQKLVKVMADQGHLEWIGKLAITARDAMHLRSVTHVLAGEISRYGSGRSDSLVSTVIQHVCMRPDDISEIAAYIAKNVKYPFSKQVRKGIRNALYKFDLKSMMKYTGKGKEFSLYDLVNLTHPDPNQGKNGYLDAMMHGNIETGQDTWESLLSNAKNDEERKNALELLIEKKHIGYMALLRNLNNIQKYGIKARTVAMALEKISNKDEVKKSKQLPFRFLTAYMNVGTDTKYLDAICAALDHSADEMDGLSENTLIAIDVSGSMLHGENKWSTPLAKAATLAALFLRKKDLDTSIRIILYSDEVQELKLASRTPVVVNAEKIISSAMRGGTNTGLVFDYMSNLPPKENVFERVIIVSDNASWDGSVMESYEKFKKETGKDPFVFAIDIAGNGTKDIEGKNVRHISGWGDGIMKYIAAARYKDNYLAYIDSMHI